MPEIIEVYVIVPRTILSPDNSHDKPPKKLSVALIRTEENLPLIVEEMFDSVTHDALLLPLSHERDETVKLDVSRIAERINLLPVDQNYEDEKQNRGELSEGILEGKGLLMREVKAERKSTHHFAQRFRSR